MRITEAGLIPLHQLLEQAAGADLAYVQTSTKPPAIGFKAGGEGQLEISMRAFAEVANGSSNATSIPPFSEPIQFIVYPLTGNKRATPSPLLTSIEEAQAWVAANQ